MNRFRSTNNNGKLYAQGSFLFILAQAPHKQNLHTLVCLTCGAHGTEINKRALGSRNFFQFLYMVFYAEIGGAA